jgi:hypothetical protein
MSDTVEGGAYLNPDGKTWHDANGEPIEAPKEIRAAKGQARENEARLAEQDQAMQEQREAQTKASAVPTAPKRG